MMTTTMLTVRVIDGGCGDDEYRMYSTMVIVLTVRLILVLKTAVFTMYTTVRTAAVLTPRVMVTLANCVLFRKA